MERRTDLSVGPYETVALGYSAFCQLFTAQEWTGFEYSVDISFEQGGGLGSAQGRASGLGYVDELIDRITGTMPNSTVQGVNSTLDENPTYFPLNQTLYIDFTHDIDISYTFAALGLSQFGEALPPTGPPANQQFIASNLVPFGARFVTEVITCDTPINAQHLPVTSSSSTGNTTYIHIISNQRTIPLGNSFSVCGNRVDGWCELNNFLAAEANRTTLADYNYACFGNYTVAANANITNGAPVPALRKRSAMPQVLSKRSSMPVDLYDHLMAL